MKTYKIFRRSTDDLYLIGKAKNPDLAFCHTIEKARFVAAALNAYYHTVSDEGNESSQKARVCEHATHLGHCGYPHLPSEASEMKCHQQNCPWPERCEDNTWWEEHPGRFF